MRFRVRQTAFLAVTLLLVSAAAIAQSADETRRIRSFFEGLDAGDPPVIAGRQLIETEAVAVLYRERHHEPFWSHGGPFDGAAGRLLEAIGQSVAHGFSADRYHRSAIERLSGADDPLSVMARDILLTDALLAQARHRATGAVFPPNLDTDWQVPQAEIDPAAFLRRLAESRDDIAAELDRLWPPDPEYARLVEKRAAIVALGDEEAVKVAPGGLLRPGQSDPRVVLLKQRLMGPGEYTELYDDDLRGEVIAFQRSAGLEPDGVVGNNTLEFLNATNVSWIDRIDANLERWRWLPRETPATYVRVNIAAYTMRIMKDGAPALSMNVIVGLPYRRTPVFTETLKYMVLNPYWNVPYSIATKDKLPLLRASSATEAGKGFEAKPNGSDTFVSVEAIDWSGVTARNFNYLLRQKPGPANALGRMKFMMPNPHAIYLHDTPSRELFARQERSFSSGCIRLEHPSQFAEWVLGNDHNAEAGNVESILATGETRTIYLNTPLPTYIVYFTAFSLDDGEVTFRRDLYDRDSMLIAALRREHE